MTDPVLTVGVLLDGRRGRDDPPAARRGHVEVVRGLEVGLVEAGEEAMRREGLEVRIQVLEPVLGIDEPVQAGPARIECVVDVDLDAVVAVRAPRREP